jgi:hypothetical protein
VNNTPSIARPKDKSWTNGEEINSAAIAIRRCTEEYLPKTERLMDGADGDVMDQRD